MLNLNFRGKIRGPLACAVALAAVLGMAGCTPATGSAPAKPQSVPTDMPDWMHDPLKAQDRFLTVNNPDVKIAKKAYGTGPATLEVPAVPAGKTRIGFTINCTGTGQWKIVLAQKTQAFSGTRCSLDKLPAANFAIDNPHSATTMKLDVSADAVYWITVYYV